MPIVVPAALSVHSNRFVLSVYPEPMISLLVLAD